MTVIFVNLPPKEELDMFWTSRDAEVFSDTLIDDRSTGGWSPQRSTTPEDVALPPNSEPTRDCRARPLYLYLPPIKALLERIEEIFQR